MMVIRVPINPWDAIGINRGTDSFINSIQKERVMKKDICLMTVILWLVSVIPSVAEDTALITASMTHSGYLFENEKISSLNGKYVLVMQIDGNLVLYDNQCGMKPSCARWHSKSYREHGQYFMAIQPDGNLVVYKGRPPAESAQAIWSSQTYGTLDNYFLAIQNDGYVVVYRGTTMNHRGVVWSSKSETRSTTVAEPARDPSHFVISGTKTFNGANDGIDLGAGLVSGITGDFTIEMDVRPGSTQQTHADIIDFNHRENVGLVIQQRGDELNNFQFFFGNGSSTSLIAYRLQADVWQHVVFQRRGTEARLYVNNALVDSKPCFAGNIYYLPGSTVTVGYNKNYGRYFKGEIKDLRIR